MNSRNVKAAMVVGNHVWIAAATTSVSSDRSSDTFARTPMVETIASFAVKPVMEAATGCHSPKPSGRNRIAIAPPSIARIESADSSTRPNPPSTNPKEDRNHITTQARNRIVPALMMNPFRRSQT